MVVVSLVFLTENKHLVNLRLNLASVKLFHLPLADMYFVLPFL